MFEIVDGVVGDERSAHPLPPVMKFVEYCVSNVSADKIVSQHWKLEEGEMEVVGQLADITFRCVMNEQCQHMTIHHH